MDGNYFDQIAHEIIKQKQRMDQLEAENRELRQRLADLRAGRGIFVDIAGSRFALRDSASPRDHVARTR
jgi:cell division protein FtsB